MGLVEFEMERPFSYGRTDVLRGKWAVLNGSISLKLNTQLTWCHAPIPAARHSLSARQSSVVCRRVRVPSCGVGLWRVFTHFSYHDPQLQKHSFAYSAPFRAQRHFCARVRICGNVEQVHRERAQKSRHRPESRIYRFFID